MQNRALRLAKCGLVAPSRYRSQAASLLANRSYNQKSGSNPWTPTPGADPSKHKSETSDKNKNTGDGMDKKWERDAANKKDKTYDASDKNQKGDIHNQWNLDTTKKTQKSDSEPKWTLDATEKGKKLNKDKQSSHEATDRNSRNASKQQWGEDAAKKSDSNQQWGYDATKKSDSTQQWGHEASKKSDSTQQWGHEASKKSDSTQQWGHDASKKSDSTKQWGHDASKKSDTNKQAGHDASKNTEHDFQKQGHRDASKTSPQSDFDKQWNREAIEKSHSQSAATQWGRDAAEKSTSAGFNKEWNRDAADRNTSSDANKQWDRNASDRKSQTDFDKQWGHEANKNPQGEYDKQWNRNASERHSQSNLDKQWNREGSDKTMNPREAQNKQMNPNESSDWKMNPKDSSDKKMHQGDVPVSVRSSTTAHPVDNTLHPQQESPKLFSWNNFWSPLSNAFLKNASFSHDESQTKLLNEKDYVILTSRFPGHKAENLRISINPKTKLLTIHSSLQQSDEDTKDQSKIFTKQMKERTQSYSLPSSVDLSRVDASFDVEGELRIRIEKLKQEEKDYQEGISKMYAEGGSLYHNEGPSVSGIPKNLKQSGDSRQTPEERGAGQEGMGKMKSDARSFEEKDTKFGEGKRYFGYISKLNKTANEKVNKILRGGKELRDDMFVRTKKHHSERAYNNSSASENRDKFSSAGREKEKSPKRKHVSWKKPTLKEKIMQSYATHFQNRGYSGRNSSVIDREKREKRGEFADMKDNMMNAMKRETGEKEVDFDLQKGQDKINKMRHDTHDKKTEFEKVMEKGHEKLNKVKHDAQGMKKELEKGAEKLKEKVSKLGQDTDDKKKESEKEMEKKTKVAQKERSNLFDKSHGVESRMNYSKLQMEEKRKKDLVKRKAEKEYGAFHPITMKEMKNKTLPHVYQNYNTFDFDKFYSLKMHTPEEYMNHIRMNESFLQAAKVSNDNIDVWRSQVHYKK